MLPADRARDFVELLGLNAHVEFVDMNAGSMQRNFRRHVQRLDEMDRVLRFLTEEINRVPSAEITKGDVDAFLRIEDLGYQLDRVEEALQKLHSQFLKFRENNDDLLRQKNEALEAYAVCRAAVESLAGGGRSSDADVGGNARDAAAGLVGFGSVAGVLLAEDQEKFARTVFRATRGNAFTHFESMDEEIMDTKTGKPVRKTVFVAYFQSTGESSALKAKLLRICQAFNVNVYDWPRSQSEARQKMNELEGLISDKQRGLAAFEEFFVGETAALLEVHRPGGGSLIEEYRLFCLKERSIYATLNLFESSDAGLRADCWFPAAEEEKIRQLLSSRMTPLQVSAILIVDQDDAVVADSSHGPSANSPPTYFRTNEFTSVFQGVVDTYGVPRYQEANPALLTIVTFPFLFGIMYGDIGHGLCVLAFGTFLVTQWHKLRKIDEEMVQMIAGGRWLIFFMGISAVYSGFLYNDFFSLGLNLFGSKYKALPPVGNKITYQFNGTNGPYAFGFDPAWKGAENELLFTNSFKMKFAVIVGFVQMLAGVILKGMNCWYFRDWLGLIFEWIPQMGFLTALVGLMDFMIIYKWAAPFKENFYKGNDNKPNIINSIIDMCMIKSPDHIVFKGQPTAMKVCFVIMIVSVPLMLLPKPLIMKFQHSSKNKRREPTNDAHALSLMEHGGQEPGNNSVTNHEEGFDFGEIMIHQMIETIEFVLGAISNTASYLRLWALSLAHQQLSLVFFQMTVKLVLGLDMNVIAIGILLFFAFAVFAGITFGIMLCMDTLECFLHALRLQWVEFQNKFYKADGRAFRPFTFTRCMTNRED